MSLPESASGRIADNASRGHDGEEEQQDDGDGNNDGDGANGVESASRYLGDGIDSESLDAYRQSRPGSSFPSKGTDRVSMGGKAGPGRAEREKPGPRRPSSKTRGGSESEHEAFSDHDRASTPGHGRVRAVLGIEVPVGRQPNVLRGGPLDKHVQTAMDPLFVPQGVGGRGVGVAMGRPRSKESSRSGGVGGFDPLGPMGPLSPTVFEGSMSQVGGGPGNNFARGGHFNGPFEEPTRRGTALNRELD